MPQILIRSVQLGQNHAQLGYCWWPRWNFAYVTPGKVIWGQIEHHHRHRRTSSTHMIYPSSNIPSPIPIHQNSCVKNSSVVPMSLRSKHEPHQEGCCSCQGSAPNSQDEASTLVLPWHGTDISPSHKSLLTLCVRSFIFYLVGQRFAVPSVYECFTFVLLLVFLSCYCVCYLYDVAAIIYVMGALNKHLYLHL